MTTEDCQHTYANAALRPHGFSFHPASVYGVPTILSGKINFIISKNHRYHQNLR